MTDRMLPTPEAGDLLDLTAEIAERELAPRAAAAEAAGEFPREVFATLGRAGLLALPYPEELGGGGQPYEVYLQVLEELAARWMTVSLGGLGARARRASRWWRTAPTSSASGGCPTMLGGAGAGRLLPVRAALRLRRRSAHDARGARRRPLPGDGHQGLDHARGRGRLLQPDGPHGRRPARRASAACCAGGHARAVVRDPRAQDGPDGLADRPGDPRRRPGAGRGPRRAPRAGLPDRDAGPGRRAPRHRRVRGRAGPGRARRGRRLRPRATGVRAGRSRSSRGCTSCWPTWTAGRRRPRAAARGRAAQGRGPAVHPAGGPRPSWSPPTPR